jgi:hypothetical protein
MPTLKEQLAELGNLKDRLSVWKAIHNLMEGRFLSKDGRPAAEAIRVHGTDSLVPEETVEDVLQAIGDGPIAEIQAQINEIESRDVVIISDNIKVQA